MSDPPLINLGDGRQAQVFAPPNRAQRRAAQKASGRMPKRGDRHAFRMAKQIMRELT